MASTSKPDLRQRKSPAEAGHEFYREACCLSFRLELSNLALDFEIRATGFDLLEIDIRIESLNATSQPAKEDEVEVSDGPSVSLPGDLWHLGEHRLICGSALEGSSYAALMGKELSAVTITDPPYNVRIQGHVSGLGAARHREFKMGSGEMGEAGFIGFLTTSLGFAALYTRRGGIIDAFIDWRHLREMSEAGRANGLYLQNLCVWVKTNGGMGSFYRSQHELVFVFCNGDHPVQNNIQLGRFGRNRTNVWHYAGGNIRRRAGAADDLRLHPTVKPIAMIADAIRDVTDRGDIVLDPFLGSGTAIIAAERTGRRCYGLELDPLYVDTAILRWQKITGRAAVNARTGRTFDDTAEGATCDER
jgi:DNA modification methylase